MCVGTEKTWSSSSSESAFVSGRKRRIRTNPITFHPAYHPKAPWGRNAPRSRGKVIATTKLLDMGRSCERNIQGRVGMRGMRLTRTTARKLIMTYQRHERTGDKLLPNT